MIRQAVVRFLVAAKHLLHTALHRTADLLLLVVPGKRALDEHVLLAVCDVLAVNGVEITLGVAQIMHRIEHVGLPAAVVPEQAIHFCAEGQIRTFVVFEMQQVKMFENHDANFTIFARPWT